MQTNLADWIKDTPEGIEANSILRKCVHCGFCLATCPTYNLLGDELDSPRGRIYLMKQMLEGAPVTESTQLHLDRCLTCRSCESTCPSGVQYGRLVDIGRDLVEKKVGRSTSEALKRTVLRKSLPNTGLFKLGLAVGRAVKGMLPDALAKKMPASRRAGRWPAPRHARKLLVLRGCVQPVLAPDIDAALARVLDRFGVSLITADAGGCCGAIAHHLNAQAEGHGYMQRNIDAWWPHVEAGIEGIVVTSSGCGATVAEYGHLLRNDDLYAAKAAKVSSLFMDTTAAVGVIGDALLKSLEASPVADTQAMRVAFHSPCSLQHGLKIRGVVEGYLHAAGYELTQVPEGHLCCGSAGTYSLLQPELSQQLLNNKVAALESAQPDVIATANIGCLTHIESGLAQSSRTPIKHWVELLDQRLDERERR